VSKLKLQVVKLKRKDFKTFGDVGLTCNLLSEASEVSLKNKVSDLQRELDQERLSSQLLKQQMTRQESDLLETTERRNN
jgi:hypothetical protein